jgi:hypothetical protein
MEVEVVGHSLHSSSDRMATVVTNDAHIFLLYSLSTSIRVAQCRSQTFAGTNEAFEGQDKQDPESVEFSLLVS